jgi:CRISPR-associated protein Cmr4
MANETANKILGLYAETSIHAGSGSNLGVIDLPIQREAHTNWPCVYGSALKGPLRTLAKDESWCDVVFGPAHSDTDKGESSAGALSVGDARLLLLPVRSLTTHFKWVTCPAILERMKADCRRLGLENEPSFSVPEPKDKENAVVNGETTGKLYLEELQFTLQPENLNGVIDAIAPLMRDSSAKDRLQKQLVIVHNDIFNHLSQYATPITPHVKLKENKTSENLWYEESLPPDTLLYSALIMQKSRKGDKTAKDLMEGLSDLLKDKYLQIGGNETTGMGWCRMALVGNHNETV